MKACVWVAGFIGASGAAEITATGELEVDQGTAFTEQTARPEGGCPNCPADWKQSGCQAAYEAAFLRAGRESKSCDDEDKEGDEECIKKKAEREACEHHYKYNQQCLMQYTRAFYIDADQTWGAEAWDNFQHKSLSGTSDAETTNNWVDGQTTKLQNKLDDEGRACIEDVSGCSLQSCDQCCRKQYNKLKECFAKYDLGDLDELANRWGDRFVYFSNTDEAVGHFMGGVLSHDEARRGVDRTADKTLEMTPERKEQLQERATKITNVFQCFREYTADMREQNTMLQLERHKESMLQQAAAEGAGEDGEESLSEDRAEEDRAAEIPADADIPEDDEEPPAAKTGASTVSL